MGRQVATICDETGRNYVLLPATEEILEEMRSCEAAQDDLGISLMVADEKLLLISCGTKVKILEAANSEAGCKVRILGGQFVGEKAFAPRAYLSGLAYLNLARLILARPCPSPVFRSMPEQSSLRHLFRIDNPRRQKNIRRIRRIRHRYIDRGIRIESPLASKAHPNRRNVFADRELIIRTRLADTSCQARLHSHSLPLALFSALWQRSF